MTELDADDGDYIVAIPTYRRAALLATDTLLLLAEGGVPAAQVHVYVADADEASIYQDTLPTELYGSLRVGSGPGVTAARNRIAAEWPAGQRIVQCDDDLIRLFRLDSANHRLNPMPAVDEFFRWAFAELDRTGLSLWGIAPVTNHFYMNDRTTADLKFCIGQMFGILNRPDERLTVPSKEDYELTLRRFEADGGVLRFNWMAVKAEPFYTTPGGCATGDRVAEDSAATDALMARWPGLVRENPARKGPHRQIKLVNPRVREFR